MLGRRHNLSMGKTLKPSGRGRPPTSWKPLRARDWLVLAIAAVVAVFLVVPGFGVDVLELRQEPTQNADGAEANVALIEGLEGLEVVDQYDSSQPKYERSMFGEGWADLDGDNCNTRNEILSRDLSRPTYREGTNDCVVQTGTLAEPYTGSVVEFVRGQGTSELVQIDHVVALADAWRAGAWQWDPQTRLEFANDPLNLLAVDGASNYEKGALTADQWLPPNEDFQCDYVARQVAVKAKWGLSVTRDEADVLWDVLRECPEVALAE